MKHQDKLGRIKQRGAILITLIMSMVIMALTVGWILSYSTTSLYGELLANRQLKAYYIAETGINYARSLFSTDPSSAAYTNGPFPTDTTFTLSNGQFTVRTYDKPGDPKRLIIESTGAVQSGWLTARQLVIRDIAKAAVAGSTMIGEDPIAFNAVDPAAEALDPVWTPVTETVTVSDTGELEFQGNESAIVLNPAAIDLSTAWETNGGLLSYFVQVKIDITKLAPGKYYMMGISFRIHPHVSGSQTMDSYGVSFYRFKGDTCNFNWCTNSGFTTGIRNDTSNLPHDGTIYAVLWKKVDGLYTLLASTPVIDASYGIATYKTNDWVLAQWASLFVRVNEKFLSGASGPSRNFITAYVQSPSLYPDGTINWNFNNFKKITWTYLNADADSTSTEVRDGTFPSSGYPCTGAACPPEFGVHGFYDSTGSGTQLFDDFGTIIQGMGGGGVQG